MTNLTKHSERNKQISSNIQREHRKGKINPNFLQQIFSLVLPALAPFINQLRDLHHLSNDIEKKIEKHLSTLKIKSNEQREFLQTISEILHGHEKFHLIINELNENESHIEIQEQEIEHLSSILFRAQYSIPCLESSPIKLHRTPPRSTIPSMKN